MANYDDFLLPGYIADGRSCQNAWIMSNHAKLGSNFLSN